jgi:flagellar hook-length control protein FliK
MPHVAFDLSTSLAAPAASVGQGPLGPGGNARNGFDGHLQRAGQDGGKPKDTAADNSPANGSAAAETSSDDSRGAPSPSQRNAAFHAPPGNDSTRPANDDGSAVDKSHGNSGDSSSSTDQPKAGAAKDKLDPDSAPTPAIGVQLVVAANASVAPQQTVAGPDPTISLDGVSQVTQSAAIPTTKAASPSTSPPADASGSPAGATLTGQTVGTNVPPAALNGSSTSANKAIVLATAAISAPGNSSAFSPDGPQSIQPPLGIAADGKPAPGAASAATITNVSATDGPSTIAADVRTASANGLTSDTTAGPNSPPPIRDPHLIKDASAIASVVDAQAIATAASIIPTTADGLPADPSRAGSTRKQDAAAAIDNTTAKSATQPAGQTPPSGAAPQTADSSNGVSSASAGASAGEVDRVKFLQRVSSAFRAADEQGGQIRLRLSPPELGSMRLELTLRNGLMTAHVQAETDTARNMLLDHLPQLRERLADHNIKIDHFDVELMNQSKNGTPQNFAGQRDSGYSLGQDGARRTPSQATGAAAVSSLPRARNSDGRLDVTV